MTKALEAAARAAGLDPDHEGDIKRMSAGVIAFLENADREADRDAVLAARTGDGQAIFRDDMSLCQPAACAGIARDAALLSLKKQAGA